jgi:hypothetical protein
LEGHGKKEEGGRRKEEGGKRKEEGKTTGRTPLALGL